MTHASWNNERGRPSGPGHDNERLEYLGDAVLELIVGEYLFRRFPDYDEGQLTQLRAALVNTTSLARLAGRLDLGDALMVGKGAAKTGAHRLPSLLANAFEAMIGAIFLDQGYRVATRVFVHNMGDLAEWSDENYKGKLQEKAQERTGSTPSYRVSSLSGGNGRQYRAEAIVAGEVLGTGTAPTKQAAEQAAAREALTRLGGRRRRPAATAAAQAVGAAQRAAEGAAGESVRARRRIAEAAADASAAAAGSGGRRREKPAEKEATTASAAAAAAESATRRRGLLGALARAAEALVGRPLAAMGDEAPPAAPAPAPPEPAVGAETEAESRPRGARRGRRGGRGRRRPTAVVAPGDATRRPPSSGSTAAKAAAPATGGRAKRSRGRRRPGTAAGADAAK